MFAFFPRKGIIAELLKATKRKAILAQLVEVRKNPNSFEPLVSSELPGKEKE